MPVNLYVDEKTYVQPDMSIYCGDLKTKGSMILTVPVLTAEILSPGSKEKDLHLKRDIYHTLGVKYYLIIDLEESKVLQLIKGESNYILLDSNEFDFGDCKVNVSVKQLLQK